MPLFTTWCKQQQLLYSCFVTLFCLNNNNCWTDLYNGDLQTTIILFKHHVSSYKTDWIFTDIDACFVRPFLYQCKQWDEWSRSRLFVAIPSLDLYKCKHRCVIVVVCDFSFTFISVVCCWYIFVTCFVFIVFVSYSFCLQFKQCERKTSASLWSSR